MQFLIKNNIISMGDNMLVNTKKMLESARVGKYAIPHFNINNLEWTRFILEECEANNSPVILGVSEGAAKYMGGFNVVSAIVKELDKSLNIQVPVALHLDHGSSLESCIKAIDSGFTSVMIDASKYDLDKNIEITSKVVEYAREKNVTVEAEVGHIGGNEDGISAELAYAKVDDAVKLYQTTNIDSLAPALGSVHGLYKGEPKLDFDKMKEIADIISAPLVLHGGTGIDDEKIRKAIESGICKLNINTELQIEWTNAVKEFLKTSTEYDPRKVIKSGEVALKTAVKHKIELLGSNNKA